MNTFPLRTISHIPTDETVAPFVTRAFHLSSDTLYPAVGLAEIPGILNEGV
jgi:hypothetical protein